MTQPNPPQEGKKPWQSVTFWTDVVTFILGTLTTAGVVTPGVGAMIPPIISGLATAVSGLLGIWGRARAKGPLTLS